MTAGGCLPPRESTQREERPGYYSVQKRRGQDWEWSRCWMRLAPYGPEPPFIEVSSKN